MRVARSLVIVDTVTACFVMKNLKDNRTNLRTDVAFSKGLLGGIVIHLGIDETGVHAKDYLCPANQHVIDDAIEASGDTAGFRPGTSRV